MHIFDFMYKMTEFQDNKRRTLQRNDIAMAITKYDQFDFLIDIVPRYCINRIQFWSQAPISPNLKITFLRRDDIKPTTKREESSVRMVPDQVSVLKL